MSSGSHGRPSRRRRSVWRLGTPAVVLVCGALFVVSADNSEGTDLRPGRYNDLASLVEAEQQRYQQLQRRLAVLNQEVATLTEAVQDDAVQRQSERAERLEGAAGLDPVTGPGVTVVLSDAPDEVIAAAQQDDTRDLNELIVHQQDIQAVVNAMWRAGAEAVMIEGQRVITTTGIKCEGNSVLLHGVPYPQPYEITAVGDVVDLVDELDSDSSVLRYRARAADPELSVGWEREVESRVRAPAYDGITGLTHATVVR